MEFLIDCKKVTSDIFYYSLATYNRGSIVYGTTTKHSDHDVLVVMPDNYAFINDLDCTKNDKVDSRIHSFIIEDENIDGQIVKKSDFIDMIHNHEPLALEAIFLDTQVLHMDYDFRQHFKLDKWRLRQTFCSIANNSWAKAGKKMTVEKDLDMMCGIKSLFHSIRLLVFACQIAEHGKIIDYSACCDLWKTILYEYYNTLAFEHHNSVWEYYKAKYKPEWNAWHSRLVELCPRPEQNV